MSGAATQARVPLGLSDLFFNRDLGDCVNEDAAGDFESYDRPKMLAEAESTITAVESLGINLGITADDLVDDFLDRV